MNVSHASQSSAASARKVVVNGSAPPRPSVTTAGLRVDIVRASHAETREATHAIATANARRRDARVRDRSGCVVFRIRFESAWNDLRIEKSFNFNF
jgi:hypothetical protein